MDGCSDSTLTVAPDSVDSAESATGTGGTLALFFDPPTNLEKLFDFSFNLLRRFRYSSTLLLPLPAGSDDDAAAVDARYSSWLIAAAEVMLCMPV